MGFRIGIGGIAIESSTFSPHPSTLEDFTILRGEEMASRYPFLPGWRMGGREDVTWLPCLHARAIPGGPVTADAYATMKAALLERIRAALPLDGFYFDIHGAMSVLGMEDAEADLAAAVREVVGPACLISTSMDLHGNVSAPLVERVDLFTAYRLAPHDDAMETRERACANLVDCLDEGVRPLRAWIRLPIILPGERTSTLVEPGKTVYARLAESDGVPGVLDASLWVGYVWADEPRSGAAVVVTGTDAAAIRGEAEKIARRYWNARHAFEFVAPAGSADWCIERALELGGTSIFISDSGDNPTAGGVGDVPHLLERLIAHPAFAGGERTAIYASIVDPAAVAACAAAGAGGEVSVELGGKLDPVHGRPLPVRGRVETLLSASPEGNELTAISPGGDVPGPHQAWARAAAIVRSDRVGGAIAVIRVGGVHAIVTSRRKPYHYVRDMLALGLDPAEHHVTAVKIGYLVPDLRRAARHALLALTPGAVNQDIPSLTYTRVPRPVFPLDPDMPEPAFDVRVFEPASRK